MLIFVVFVGSTSFHISTDCPTTARCWRELSGKIYVMLQVALSELLLFYVLACPLILRMPSPTQRIEMLSKQLTTSQAGPGKDAILSKLPSDVVL